MFIWRGAAGATRVDSTAASGWYKRQGKGNVTRVFWRRRRRQEKGISPRVFLAPAPAQGKVISTCFSGAGAGARKEEFSRVFFWRRRRRQEKGISPRVFLAPALAPGKVIPTCFSAAGAGARKKEFSRVFFLRPGRPQEKEHPLIHISELSLRHVS